MSRGITLPEGARFTCQSCGRCCQGWDVPVDAETAARLRAHDWGTEPFEPMGSTGQFRIRQVDGRCYFLRPDNHCRIHVELSYDAKPPVCRGFPLSVLEVEGRQFARLSYWCPTVVANTGKPLEQQGRWVRDTARHADVRTAALRLEPGVEISGGDFDRLHHALREVVHDGAHPIGDRVAALAGLVRRLASSPGLPVEAAVQQARRDGIGRLAADARRGGAPAAGRRAISLYLLHDRPRGRMAGIRRFAEVALFTAGLARLRTRAVPACASRRMARRVTFQPSRVAGDLLARYLASKIDSRRYVAGEATVVGGINLLLVAYGLISELSRLRAATDRRTECSDEDVTLAVQAADLLVVEHSDLRQGAVQRRLVDGVLERPDLGADVLAFVHPAGRPS